MSDIQYTPVSEEILEQMNRLARDLMRREGSTYGSEVREIARQFGFNNEIRWAQDIVDDDGSLALLVHDDGATAVTEFFTDRHIGFSAEIALVDRYEDEHFCIAANQELLDQMNVRMVEVAEAAGDRLTTDDLDEIAGEFSFMRVSSYEGECALFIHGGDGTGCVGWYVNGHGHGGDGFDDQVEAFDGIRAAMREFAHQRALALGVARM